MIAIDGINWEKVNGMVPAVIQDWQTHAVLMLGYMNREALQVSLDTGKVTFFSRSRRQLWTKGESSGHFLLLKSVQADCDQDTLLVRAEPMGPTCHQGTTTCFGEPESQPLAILERLSRVIRQRREQMPETSYTASLLAQGTAHIAQKVGEEGVEVALAAVAESNEKLTEEAADLLFHLLVLLEARELSLHDVCRILEQRHQ